MSNPGAPSYLCTWQLNHASNLRSIHHPTPLYILHKKIITASLDQNTHISLELQVLIAGTVTTSSEPHYTALFMIIISPKQAFFPNLITKPAMMRREQLRHCFLCGALLRLVEAADKYFIQGISKSFHSLEDIASISFRKKKKKNPAPRLWFVQTQKRSTSEASGITENKSKHD